MPIYTHTHKKQHVLVDCLQQKTRVKSEEYQFSCKTPQSTALLKKSTVPQLVKKFTFSENVRISLHSQELASVPYPKARESDLSPSHPSYLIFSLTALFYLYLVLQSVSFLLVVPFPATHVSYITCMPHVLPISSSLI